jgi:diguanylate cyclase
VEEINEELLSGGGNETEAVVSAIDRLVKANDQMQQQLVSADQRLREQARQIESHAVEARTDALTGLANRRAFDAEMARRLAEFRRHGRTFSVAMIDVDYFKRFNDTHGHQAGDAVLNGLAGVLRDSAREMDLVARYGGEEFVIVFPGTSLVDGGSAAERVRKAIETTPFRFQDADLHVTASVGVAEMRRGEDVARLIRRADIALYASKKSGRNRVCLHDGQATELLGAARNLPEKTPQQGPPLDVSAGPRPAGSITREAPKQPAVAVDGPEPAASAELYAVDREGLCDRAALEALLGRRLGQWRMGGRPPAVVLVRVDQYEKITLDHGERAGKLAGQNVLRLLRAAVSDLELLTRYDAATLAVLFPGADLAATAGMAEQLREGVADCKLPAEKGQFQFTISVSAAAAADGDDVSRLLGRAEEALVAAQKSGGDCSYFHNGQWSEIAQAVV